MKGREVDRSAAFKEVIWRDCVVGANAEAELEISAAVINANFIILKHANKLRGVMEQGMYFVCSIAHSTAT